MKIDKDVFRAYDIRGIVDKQLTPAFFELLGKSYAQEMQKRKLRSITIGYDGRISSPALCEGLITGLRECGIDVINIGMVPTPCLYFAVSDLNTDAGIMITGSHNPTNYNGCKMLMGGEPLALEKIQQLCENILNEDFPEAEEHGSITETDFLGHYISELTDGVKLKNEYHIVVDSGNGVTGNCAPEIYRKIGCKVTELYCEVDGTFPNHHPDPGNPKNLREAQDEVKAQGSALGLAFDGDGDRVGLIADDGRVIYPDRILMLLAKDLLSRHPCAPIIFDVKCSSMLSEVIEGAGGKPIMWKTGHSLVKMKMKETGSLLAGEMSGHIFFAENWPMSDDALLAGVRLLQIMDKENKSCSELFAAYPEGHSTPEINLQSTDKEKFEIIEKLKQNKGDFDAAQIIEIDGLRVEYEHGWGLVRASNTSPLLVLRFEAKSPDKLKEIINAFVAEIGKVSPKLDLAPLQEHLG